MQVVNPKIVNYRLDIGDVVMTVGWPNIGYVMSYNPNDRWKRYYNIKLESNKTVLCTFKQVQKVSKDWLKTLINESS